jgi:hypothetical protein
MIKAKPHPAIVLEVSALLQSVTELYYLHGGTWVGLDGGVARVKRMPLTMILADDDTKFGE